MKNTINLIKKSPRLWITSMLITVVAVVAGFLSMGVDANANVPQTIKMGDGPILSAYIGTEKFAIKRTSDGTTAYCIDYPKLNPRHELMVYQGEKDAGYAYLMQNGHPNKSITGDANKDYYITQYAIWWYIDDTTGTNYVSNAFKNTLADPHGLRPHMKRLVEGAKKAKAVGYVQPTIEVSVPSQTFSYSGSKQTYYSSNIKVSGNKVDGRFTVTVSGIAGAYVADVNGNAKTAFAPGESFKIAVPFGKANELNNKVRVVVRGTGKLSKAHSYRPTTNPNIQTIIPMLAFTQTYNLEKQFDLTLSTSKLTVYKKDSETKAMLSGAKFALYDINGVTLKTWTTDDKSITIIGLVPGKYIIKELEAPAGYNMIKDSVEVVLNPAEHKSLTIYNIKQEQTRITIVKRDEKTTRTLAGAKISLTNSQGKVVSTWTSSDKGRRFTGLPEGKYTITELEAPAGYKLLKKTIAVELVAGKDIVVDLYNREIDKPVTPPEKKITKLRVAKYDAATNQLLSNAKLQIKNMNGEVVKEWTTTNEEFYIENLPAGKYYLIEIEAPTGYVLYTEKIEFELFANNTIQTVQMFNYPEVPVPITDTQTNKLTMIIGGIVTAAGAYLVYFTKKRNA